MRTVFEEELQRLFIDLTRLGNAANESLHKAIKAFNTRDRDLAHELFSDDLRINAATIDIEQDAFRVIVLQQPVARDLRKVFTVLQASTDIERIADHAVTIARSTIKRDDDSESNEEIDQYINQMAEIISQMINDALEAVSKHDSDAAREIAARDKEVNELYRSILRSAAKLMEEDHESVNVGIGYLQIAGSLERMGDYAKNICERVVYLNTGTIIELG